MRKSTKKKQNGEEKSPKKSVEVESNGSLISDDISDQEDQSTAKKGTEAEDSDGRQSEHSEKSDKAAAKTRKTPKSSKSKKKKRNEKTKIAPKLQMETEYEVDRVIGMKEKKGKTLYLIRWKGYNKDSDTWEPESELSCPTKIAAYLEANKKKDGKEEEKEEKEEKEKEEEEEEEQEEKEEEQEEKEEKKSKKAKKETPAKKRKADVKEKKVAAKRARAESSESEEETKEYEVEKIIEVHHKRNGKKEYLVRWKGYSSKDDTWEPEEHVQCPELISKFNARVEKAKQVTNRDLRVNPSQSEPYSMLMMAANRRLSRRCNHNQRVRYQET